MSEEEKESIEEFRKQLRLAINIDDVTTAIRNDNAQTILNLIEKLQKENKELKEEIGVDYTTVYLKGVYDEREKQQKEIKEKNKTINLMAEHIFYNQDDTFPLAYSIKDTKDYFENKAKKR